MVELFGNKNAFWQALIFTIIVFGFGIIMGFFIEDNRASSVNSNLLNSEISFLDEQLAVKSIFESNVSCESAVGKTFDFADKVYADALTLEEFDGASTFTQQLSVLHKRYDLLRLTLWLEAVKIRKNCNANFHTVVYLYDYKTENPEKEAKQVYYSRILSELKSKNKGEVLLIPIAANMNLSSVDLALSQYNLNDFPVIIVDEKKVISDLITSENLDKEVMSF